MLTTTGETVERYTLSRRIGSGGFGTVYLARDLFLEENVAVKMPIEDFPDMLSFLREPRLLHRVRSPHIVELRDIERIQGRLCLVMEYVEGGSLRDRMGAFGRGHRLPEDFCVATARRVLEALQIAHGVGVLHRDIKPDNVLIGEGALAKLTDFGIAGFLEAHSREARMQPAGTLMYMSPECICGEISPAVDLWATMAMLYEMLGGRPPFPGPSRGEIVKQVMECRVTPLRHLAPDVGSGLEELVMRSLSRDPAARLPTLEEALASLEKLQVAGNPSVPPRAAAVAHIPSGAQTEVRPEQLVHEISMDALPALIERMQAMIESGPLDPALHRAIGDAWRRLGEEPAAFEAYERAFLIDRTDRMAAEAVAELGANLRRHARRIEALVALAEMQPETPTAHRRLAVALEEQGQGKRAEAHRRRAEALEKG